MTYSCFCQLCYICGGIFSMFVQIQYSWNQHSFGMCVWVCWVLCNVQRCLCNEILRLRAFIFLQYSIDSIVPLHVAHQFLIIKPLFVSMSSNRSMAHMLGEKFNTSQIHCEATGKYVRNHKQLHSLLWMNITNISAISRTVTLMLWNGRAFSLTKVLPWSNVQPHFADVWVLEDFAVPSKTERKQLFLNHPSFWSSIKYSFALSTVWKKWWNKRQRRVNLVGTIFLML